MQSREELRIAESIQLEATGPVLWRQDGQHRELLMFTGDSIHCCRYPSVMPSRFAKVLNRQASIALTRNADAFQIDNFAHNITCVDMPCMSSPNEETPQRRLLLGCRDGTVANFNWRCLVAIIAWCRGSLRDPSEDTEHRSVRSGTRG